jgi:hypothetical protein
MHTPVSETRTWEPPVPVDGSRNEVIATKPRTRGESIRYASKAADILTVVWLDWYEAQTPLL